MKFIICGICLPFLFTVLSCVVFNVDASVGDTRVKHRKPKEFPPKGGQRIRRHNTEFPRFTLNYSRSTERSDKQKEVCLYGVILNPPVISNREILKYMTCQCRNYISMCDNALVQMYNNSMPPFSADNEQDNSGGIMASQCENYVRVYINCGRELWNEEINQTTNLRRLCSSYQECQYETHWKPPFSELGPSYTNEFSFLDNLTCCWPDFWPSFPPWVSHYTSPVNSNSRSTTSAAFTNTLSTTNATRITTASNRSKNNQTTYIIVGVTTSCVFLVIISASVLLVKKLRRQSPETNSNLSSSSVNLLAWIRGKIEGNVQRESSTSRLFFRGKLTEQPKPESNLASVATNQNHAGALGNNTSSDDNVDSISNTIKDNTYATINNVGGITSEYSSLDEASKYSHLYSDVLNNDPTGRPALPLPLHVANQPSPYYSIAQPHINGSTNHHSNYVPSLYVELYDETSVINQPINTTDYIIPSPISSIVYAQTEPHTYISILPTND